jgi:hypothetical protein
MPNEYRILRAIRELMEWKWKKHIT